MGKKDKRKQLLKILLGVGIFSFIGMSVIGLINFKQKIVEDSIEFHQKANILLNKMRAILSIVLGMMIKKIK